MQLPKAQQRRQAQEQAGLMVQVVRALAWSQAAPAELGLRSGKSRKRPSKRKSSGPPWFATIQGTLPYSTVHRTPHVIGLGGAVGGLGGVGGFTTEKNFKQFDILFA